MKRLPTSSPPGSSGSRGRVVAALLAWLGPFVGLLIVVLVFEGYHLAWQPEREFIVRWQRLLDWPLGSDDVNTLRVAAIAKQTAIVGVGALGMTVIIIAGGIDLSVGSMLALTSVVLALFLRDRPPDWMAQYLPGLADGWDPTPVAVALLLVMLAGIAAGAFNGLMITRLGLVPFIVTLGTMMVYRGMAEWLADQKKVVVDHDAIPGWLASLLDPPGADSWLPLVCPAVWIVIALAIALALVLRFTVFGRYVFAIGSNEEAARLCGIPVRRMKIAFYALGGFFMAVAGVFGFSEQYAQGDPSSGVAKELDIIAAVVIGGGSLSGGRGSVLGSLLGALTMTTLQSGCDYAGISVSMQKIVIGAIIVAAVAIDGWLHPRK